MTTGQHDHKVSPIATAYDPAPKQCNEVAHMKQIDVLLIIILCGGFHSVPFTFGPVLKLAVYVVAVAVVVFHREIIKGWRAGKA